MSRCLWIASAILLPLLVASVPVSFIAAAWLRSEPLGITGFVLLVTAVCAIPSFGIWTDENKPAPLLSRSDRKRLRDEKRRIAVDAEIARMEREAGIR